MSALSLGFLLVSAIARGVNNQGDVAGNDFPACTSRAAVWLVGLGDPALLACATDLDAAAVYGIRVSRARRQRLGRHSRRVLSGPLERGPSSARRRRLRKRARRQR
jgi:hypothetical protein